MTTNPDLNDVPDEFKRDILHRMRRYIREVHLDSKCHYHILKNWIFTSTGKPNIVLVRQCTQSCKKERDRSDMMSRHFIRFDELHDGVEIHLSSKCHFTGLEQLDGSYIHEKVCYCPGNQPTALR